MNMTHYMELLATNQPWNLIIFMAIPIILAETIAISELYILFKGVYEGPVRELSRWCGIAVGLYFLAVFVYLMVTAVAPITKAGQWRGVADVVAVGFYLLGVVPLFGMAMLEFGWIGKGRDPRGRMALHAALVGVFLVVGHVAMIFGMLDPTVLGGTMGGAKGHGH